MLDRFEEKKRILIIDETTLGESNWQTKTWQGRAYSVSQKIILVTPRISMIVALDTEGEVYWSLM